MKKNNHTGSKLAFSNEIMKINGVHMVLHGLTKEEMDLGLSKNKGDARKMANTVHIAGKEALNPWD